jgi:hypothetical protein
MATPGRTVGTFRSARPRPGTDVDTGEDIAVAVLADQLREPVTPVRSHLNSDTGDLLLYPLNLQLSGVVANHTVAPALHKPLGRNPVRALTARQLGRGPALGAAVLGDWARRRLVRIARHVTGNAVS